MQEMKIKPSTNTNTTTNYGNTSFVSGAVAQYPIRVVVIVHYIYLSLYIFYLSVYILSVLHIQQIYIHIIRYLQSTCILIPYSVEYGYTVFYTFPIQTAARFPNRLSVGGRWNGKWGPPNRRLVDHRPIDQSEATHPPARFSAFPGWELHHDWYYHTVPYCIYSMVWYNTHVPVRINFARPNSVFFLLVSLSAAGWL